MSEMQQRGILELPPPPPGVRIAYGSGACQFGELRLPPGAGPHPVAIVIHGGFWRSAYSLDHLGHFCEALRNAGLAAWSLEYRRLGNPGGGWQGTFEDILTGSAHALKLPQVDARRAVITGHSAGGQLALYAGCRKPLPLRGVVALAPVADLRRAWELKLSNGAVAELLGGAPDQVPERYRHASPIEMLPARLPQRLIHGAGDDTVPLELSRRYEKAAIEKGDDCRLIALPGAGHFELIDPRAKEFPVVRDALLALL
jgi:dipeptidyl aminopeptidase/acylaminoacyl peptidase